MIEIRAHGRGGMGVVTMMEILAKAAGLDGKFSQAFPAFGPERRGAPVRAFCRISDQPITIRSQVYNPDYVVILEPSLLNLPETSEGLKEDSALIVNSKERMGSRWKVHSYDATGLALKILGKDIVNTAMLGFFAKVANIVSLESLLKVLDERFPEKLAEPNKQLLREAFGEAKNE